MRPVYVLLTTVLLCTLCSAAPAQEQQEGQTLSPPNLTPFGNGIYGMRIDSIVGFPITATINAENIYTDDHGKSIALRFRSKIYRDSKGRTRLEFDPTPLGEPAKPGWSLMIEIYDPTTGTYFTLYPSTKAFDQSPRPDEKPQQFYDEPIISNKIDPRLLLPLRHKEVTQRELAHDVVGGMVVRHGRESIKVPPKYEGNKTGYKTLTDYWFSQELQAFVLVKRTGPGKSQHTVNLSDISRDEPNPSLFTVPPDYRLTPPAQPCISCSQGAVHSTK
jgi:hypothetical protein